MGILSLNRASLYRLIKEWNSIHAPNAGGKSLSQYCIAELDDVDVQIIFSAMWRGITGTPDEPAKKLLAEPK